MKVNDAGSNRIMMATGISLLGVILFIIGRVNDVLPLLDYGKVVQVSLLDSLSAATWIWVPILVGIVAYMVWLWIPDGNSVFKGRYWFLPSISILLLGLYHLFVGLHLDVLAWIVLLVLAAALVLLLSALPSYPLGAKSTKRAPITLLVDITFGLLLGYSTYLLMKGLAGRVTALEHNWFMRNFFGLLMVIIYVGLLLIVGQISRRHLSVYVGGLWPLLLLVFADLFYMGGSVLVGLVALAAVVVAILFIIGTSARKPLNY